MQDYFKWFNKYSSTMHTVVLAAEANERLVSIHPFLDGNGRTYRLVMNLILLQRGFVIANIKGDSRSRLAYYKTLENAQVNGNKEQFITLVAKTELSALKRYLGLLK
jgi:Fic family protein